MLQKKRAYRRKPRKASKAPAKRRNFAKVVRSVVNKMAEVKRQTFASRINACASNGTGQLLSLTPITPYTSFISIVQGPGQGSRIGVKISPKSLIFKGVITPSPYNATTNPNPAPCYVKLFFLTRKDSPTSIVSTFSDLFQQGSSSSGLTPNLVDLTKSINKDEWMIHSTRTYKIGHASNEGSGSSAVNSYWMNNDFKLCQMFSVNLTKAVGKVIRYDDNNVVPTSKCIYLLPVVYRADNQTPNVAELPITIDYSIDITYTDL